jgi:hypothetical protein
LVERIAGQAARDLTRPERLSSTAMARIAGQIDAAQVQAASNSKPLRLGWFLVMGAFLLGIVTAASAAHLDLLPRWLTRSVHDKPELVSHRAASRAAKARPFAESDRPTLPAMAATPGASVPMATEAEVKRAAKPLPQKRADSKPRRQPSVAMRDAEPGRFSVPTGQLLTVAPSSAEHRPPEQQAAPTPAPPLAPAVQPAPSSQRSPSPNLPAAVRSEPSVAVPHAAMYLKEIVRALRIDHSPSQALALLDRHASELAGNAFAEESLLLRVEAMLALGQRSAVLRLLDGTPLTDVAASRGLLLTRGELRAAANRCADSIGDFNLVLTEARRPPKQALLGRATCKQKLGDAAGANADFDRYRHEFPGDPLP